MVLIVNLKYRNENKQLHLQLGERLTKDTAIKSARKKLQVEMTAGLSRHGQMLV